MPATLDEVLSYSHPGLIRRYRKEHGASQQEAEEVFRETLKWLYLCHKALASDGFGCTISHDLEKIDQMWHLFLLFTMDYADFCDRCFGVFLHHVPDEAEDEESAVDEEEIRERMSKQLGLVYDLLGEETLKAWYDECRFALSA